MLTIISVIVERDLLQAFFEYTYCETSRKTAILRYLTGETMGMI